MVQNIAKEFYKLLETISAQAKTGLAFSQHPYDIYRYKQILDAIDRLTVLLPDDANVQRLFSALGSVQIDIGSQEYVTPKVAVAAVVFNSENQVLLVKRLDGFWALPGGYADIPLDPIENTEKEVKEETGLDIDATSLIGIYDSHVNKFPSIGRQVYLLVFLASLQGGILSANLDETTETRFFDLHSLPELLPLTLSQIEHGFRLNNGEFVSPVIERNM